MPKRDIIVIGASAGGMEALKTLLAPLPADLPAAVFIVWHMASEHPSLLPDILERVCALPVAPARDGENIEIGRVYVATPNHHLITEPDENGGPGCIRVTRGPKENMFRPSIDVLFRSAARAFGSRVIGVVLTGMLDDGASGLYGIKERGGLAIVQDPLDALYPNMPINAMKAAGADYVVPAAEMGNLLSCLAQEPRVEPGAEGGDVVVSKQMDCEVRIALQDTGLEIGVLELGEPSIFTCPDCHGTLLQLKDGPLTRFRCHVGHAFSLNTLLAGVTKSVEDTLWNALRVVEESELLLRHMAQHFRNAGYPEAGEALLQKEQEAKKRADLIRQAVMRHEIQAEDTPQSQ